MGDRLTRAQVIIVLKSVAESDDDPEVMHIKADDLLLSYVPEDVRSAYEAVRESAGWWAHA